MHVNYVMWGARLTGGTATFTEIGKRLIKRGHKVTITALDDGCGTWTSKGFKPSWEPDVPIQYIRVPIYENSLVPYLELFHRLVRRALERGKQPSFPVLHEHERIHKIVDYIPDCDINVATYFPSAFPVCMSKKGAARFYHMQHYEPLFFNTESTRDKTALSMSRLAELSYCLPLNRIANSSWLQKTVKDRHGSDSFLVNHAIRHDFFYPRPEIEKPKTKRILSLGKSRLFWKGVDTLAKALRIVSRKYDQIELILYGSESDAIVDFPHRYVLNPTMEELARLYCSSHLVVSPSWYESFPAPPLEAMACGIPVVTTSIGVEDYAVNEENCLVVPPRHPTAMADAILRLLFDQGLCERFGKEGLRTAKRFTWDNTTDNIERTFMKSLG